MSDTSIAARHAAVSESPQYDAFISYSRHDITFARALERALARYRPPSDLAVPQRLLRVFRDEADFTGSDYVAAIRRHIAAAGRLIVVCSPAARASRYVNEEIALFSAARGADAIIPVLVSGLANNEAAPEREAEQAFPQALVEALAMPLAADYRGHDPQNPRIDKGGFEGPWHKLLADLYGMPRSEIEQREKRRRARNRRNLGLIVGTTMAVLVGLSIWAVLSRDEAIRQREVSAGGLLAIEARSLTGPEPEIAERQALLALEALEILRQNGGDQAEALAVLSTALGRLPQTIHEFPLQESSPVLAFSGDGLRLFRAVNQRIEVWALAGMQAEQPIIPPRPAASLISSPDARWLAAVDDGGGVSVHYTGGPIIDGEKPAPVRSLVEEGARCPVFNRDGTYFAALVQPRGGRPEAVVWRLADGRRRARLLLPQNIEAAAAGLPCLALGDGPAILVNYKVPDQDSTTVLWPWREQSSGDQIVTADVPAGPTTTQAGRAATAQPFRRWSGKTGAAFANAGELLRLIGPDPSRSRYGLLTDVAYGGVDKSKPTENQIAVRDWGSNGAIAPDGRHFSVPQPMLTDAITPLLKGYSTQLRSTTDGSRVAEIGAAGHFSAVGESFIEVRPNLVRRWEVATGRETLRLLSEAAIASVVDAPGGRYLAIVEKDRSVRLVDTAHPLERLRMVAPDLGELWFNALEVAADGGLLSLEASGGVQIVDVAQGRVLARIGKGPRMAVATGGSRAAGPLFKQFTMDKRSGGLFDLARGGLPLWKADDLDNATFSMDGRTVIFTHYLNGTITAVAAEDGRVLWTAQPEQQDKSSGRDVQISGDGRYVFATTRDWARPTILTIFSAASGEIVARREVGRPPVAISAETGSQRLAVAAGHGATILDTATGPTLRDLPAPTMLKDVAALAFLPDRQRLVMIAGSRYSTFLGGVLYSELAAFVWDIEAGRTIARIPPGVDRAKTYQDTLREEEKAFFDSASLTPDGRRMAATVYPSRIAYSTVAADRVARDAIVWDLEATPPREVLRRSGMHIAALSQDGRFALLRRDRELSAWKLAVHDLPQVACQRLKRNLSQDEWRTYLGERPYRKSCPGRVNSP